jgi:hypothetical protein
MDTKKRNIVDIEGIINVIDEYIQIYDVKENELIDAKHFCKWKRESGIELDYVSFLDFIYKIGNAVKKRRSDELQKSVRAVIREMQQK